MKRTAFVQRLAAASLICAANTASAMLLPDRVAIAARERVDSGENPALAFAYVEGGKSEVDVFGKLDGPAKLDGDTVFEIGSITKTFTATVLAQDVLAGNLTLDEPIASVWPAFKIPARGGKQITLLDLATQFSGLPRLPTNMSPADPANPYADYNIGKLQDFLAGYTLPRDPGESYEYSNLGFGLLGQALAQHAHVTYRDLIDRRIFGPLKMRMSDTILSERLRAHLAAGHGDDGSVVKNWAIDALAGAGAILSTANDMLTYLRANMGQIPVPGGNTNAMTHESRRNIGKDESTGLAWMIRHHSQGGVVWHNGGTGGYRSFIGFRTGGGRGVVILTNATASVDDLGFAALLDDAPITPAHRAIALDATSLDEYVGDYQLSDAMSINISRKDGQIFAQATHQGAFPIFADAKDDFFARVAEIRIRFGRDAQGKVTELTLHQNGDHVAPKFGSATADQSIQLDRETLRDYVGNYRISPGVGISLTLNDDQLFIQLTGQPAYPVYASAKDRFFLRVVEAQVDFERNNAGKIVALVLNQNAQKQRAERVGN